jgi:hypothetical protein
MSMTSILRFLPPANHILNFSSPNCFFFDFFSSSFVSTWVQPFPHPPMNSPPEYLSFGRLAPNWRKVNFFNNKHPRAMFTFFFSDVSQFFAFQVQNAVNGEAWWEWGNESCLRFFLFLLHPPNFSCNFQVKSEGKSNLTRITFLIVWFFFSPC